MEPNFQSSNISGPALFHWYYLKKNQIFHAYLHLGDDRMILNVNFKNTDEVDNFRTYGGS